MSTREADLIKAGESAPAVAPQQLVDATTLAESIVSGVFQRLDQTGGNNRPQATQERVSAFQEKAKALLASEKIDKDVVPTMLELIEAVKADLTAEQKKAMMEAAGQQAVKNVHDELGRAVDRYALDDKRVSKAKTVIVGEVIDEYNKLPVANRFKQDGYVDWQAMDTLVVKHVKEWSSDKDPKPAGGPAMKNSAPPSAGADATRQLDADSLNEKQREHYNSVVHFHIKQNGMPRADAEKEALRLVNNAEQKVKSSKR